MTEGIAASSPLYYSPRKRVISRGPAVSCSNEYDQDPHHDNNRHDNTSDKHDNTSDKHDNTDPVLDILETYLLVQEESLRLPGYFRENSAILDSSKQNFMGVFEKKWPTLTHPVELRVAGSVTPPPLSPPPPHTLPALKHEDFTPLISCSDELNMIYREDSLGHLADIPKSPSRAGAWKSRERKKSAVNRFSFAHFADKRIQLHDLMPIRNDLVAANTRLSAWNSNLSAAEDERTRQEAIHELISTEKTYIDDLLLVVEVFYNPLCSVASEEELSSVFVNWMQLILCNARLFRALYNTNDVNCFETVGAVFLEEVESLLGPYTRFCSAQRQAMLALQESVSPMFKAKEKECATSPKVGKLPLSTFLLKPMQRITKYPLLIKKILQHTRDSHPDYASLRDSLTRTEYLLTSVNEAVRATSRLETLERAFVKCSEELGERVKLHSATNCLGPRKLLHFGSLSKTKGSKEMFAVLFTDMLWISKVDKGRYGNKPIDLDARDFDSVKFEYYRDPFMLNNMVMTEGVKVPEQTFQFVYNDKNYCFFCNSASDAADWSDHLHGAIRNAVLLYHSNYKVFLPDPTVSGQATLTLRIVEALELSLPTDEKPTSLFAQASLHGHVQRTPVGGPKWDHTVHFVINDLNSDKINISVYKEFVFSPNMLLGKFDLSVQKLIKSGPGPWNKRLILTDTNSGMVNVSILLRYHANR